MQGEAVPCVEEPDQSHFAWRFCSQLHKQGHILELLKVEESIVYPEADPRSCHSVKVPADDCLRRRRMRLILGGLVDRSANPEAEIYRGWRRRQEAVGVALSVGKARSHEEPKQKISHHRRPIVGRWQWNSKMTRSLLRNCSDTDGSRRCRSPSIPR